MFFLLIKPRSVDYSHHNGHKGKCVDIFIIYHGNHYNINLVDNSLEIHLCCLLFTFSPVFQNLRYVRRIEWSFV